MLDADPLTQQPSQPTTGLVVCPYNYNMKIKPIRTKAGYRAALKEIEAIRFRMEQKGMTPKDLVPMIGRINRVYEILSRKRPLTLAMIQRLHSELGIPAESLIKQSDGRRAA